MASSLGAEELSSPRRKSSQRLTARMARVPQASRFFSSFSSFSNDIKVIVGENDIGDTEQMKLEVAEVVIHPMYSDSSYNNDFSILRLPSPLSFSSSISPVCLPSDATATFTGEVIWFLSINCLHRMVLYTSHNPEVQPNPIPSIHTST